MFLTAPPRRGWKVAPPSERRKERSPTKANVLHAAGVSERLALLQRSLAAEVDRAEVIGDMQDAPANAAVQHK